MASSVTNTNAAPGTAPRSDGAMGSNKLGKDEFLKLLMAQLGHQDPTSPADSNAFVAQLAQFASMEQLQQANNQLEALLVAQTANNQTAISTLVGKDVSFKTDRLHLEAGGTASILGKLEAAAESVVAVIKDSSGKEVRRIELGEQPAGDVVTTWDGRDNRGLPAPEGDYTIQLTATDSAGQAISIESRGHSHVSGVTFEEGYPELIAGGQRVKLADVLQIVEAPSPTP